MLNSYMKLIEILAKIKFDKLKIYDSNINNAKATKISANKSLIEEINIKI